MTKSPPNCADVVRDLWDYLDGEGDPLQWESLRGHLGSCTGCTSHIEFCRDFLARVQAIPVDPAKVDSMRVRVLAALAAENGTS